MSYFLRCDLATWRWGVIIVQDHFRADGAQFCSMLRKAGLVENDVSAHWGVYQGRANAGGYCWVPDHPTPWIIVVFGSNPHWILQCFVHEAVHLGEHLPKKENVDIDFPTQEVRIKITEKAFDIFYADFDARFARYRGIAAALTALFLLCATGLTGYGLYLNRSAPTQQVAAVAPPATMTPVPSSVTSAPAPAAPIARPQPSSNLGENDPFNIGVHVIDLTPTVRSLWKIKDSVKGVVVQWVDPKGLARDKRLTEGDVIVEIAQEAVRDGSDFNSKIAKLKGDGRKSALLLVAGKDGELRFVALPLVPESTLQ